MNILPKLWAKKSLGQNFLTNPRVPEWMADAAELHEGDTVLEIGPGTGALTKEFLKRGAKVVAVEADERAVEILKEEFAREIAEGNFTLHHGDIREIHPEDIGLICGQYKLISNIPYYLSGMLFRMFLEHSCQPSVLVFLTQKEVSERICRDPKESLLSLSVKAYGSPRYVKTISRGNFSPAPKVDSAIIAVSNISKNNFRDLDEAFFFETLHLGFAAKRKQLLGSLAKKFPREKVQEALIALGLKETVRGEDVSLEDWLRLTKALSPQGY